VGGGTGVLVGGGFGVLVGGGFGVSVGRLFVGGGGCVGVSDGVGVAVGHTVPTVGDADGVGVGVPVGVGVAVPVGVTDSVGVGVPLVAAGASGDGLAVSVAVGVSDAAVSTDTGVGVGVATAVAAEQKSRISVLPSALTIISVQGWSVTVCSSPTHWTLPSSTATRAVSPLASMLARAGRPSRRVVQPGTTNSYEDSCTPNLRLPSFSVVLRRGNTPRSFISTAVPPAISITLSSPKQNWTPCAGSARTS
jgi:hypothetical protein